MATRKVKRSGGCKTRKCWSGGQPKGAKKPVQPTPQQLEARAKFEREKKEQDEAFKAAREAAKAAEKKEEKLEAAEEKAASANKNTNSAKKRREIQARIDRLEREAKQAEEAAKKALETAERLAEREKIIKAIQKKREQHEKEKGLRNGFVTHRLGE